MGRRRDDRRRDRRRRKRSRSHTESTSSKSASRSPTPKRSKSRKKSSKSSKPPKSKRFIELVKKLSTLPSYSDSSDDSQERRTRNAKIRKKMFQKEAPTEENTLELYKRQYHNNNQQNEHGNNVIWDGFRWVEKNVSLAGMDQTTLVHTKKMRRVQISNLPIYMGLKQDDIRTCISTFIVANYLNNKGNTDPVVECELNSKAKSAVVELSSVEEATRFSKVGIIRILGVKCKVTRVGETMYGETSNAGLIMSEANRQAEAQAVAFQAMNSLIGDSGEFSVEKAKKLNLVAPPSRCIKVMNLCDAEQAALFAPRDFDKIYEDIFTECAKSVKLENAFIIKNHNRGIGAEAGAVFLEVASIEDAMKLLGDMAGKKYENRQFNMVCIPENTYHSHFRRLQT